MGNCVVAWLIGWSLAVSVERNAGGADLRLNVRGIGG